MGFFNILESFFFVSLAVTFVLIMMLVYHFKGRIGILEQKCDTMFDIMNNIVKEVRTIKILSTNYVNPMMIVPNNETMMFHKKYDLGESSEKPQFEFMESNQDEDDNKDEDEDENEDEDEEEYEIKKIIVSDTEYDDKKPVKIINIEINNDLEEVAVDEIDEKTESIEDELEEVDVQDENDSEEITNDASLEQQVDYRKMDISYLRTMVITRGFATDTKKMKKNDLIKLLEESKE